MRAISRLLPVSLGLEASPANLKRLEKIRVTLSKRTATEKHAAEKQVELLRAVTIMLSRKAGETDQIVWLGDRCRSCRRRSRRKALRSISGRFSWLSRSRSSAKRMVTVKLVHGVTAEFKVVVEKGSVGRASACRFRSANHQSRIAKTRQAEPVRANSSSTATLGCAILLSAAKPTQPRVAVLLKPPS